MRIGGGGRRPYKELEQQLGYRFRRVGFLKTALMHRSYRFENAGVSEDNQRLEFLGDAVLGCLSAGFLYDKHADHDEGKLTSFRSQITSGKALAECAGGLDLGRFLMIGTGEINSGGRERSSNLADALEAIIGAAYLDGGMKAARKVFNRLFVPMIDRLDGDVWADNPKGKLQEYTQRMWKRSPVYKLTRKDGPAHSAFFTVEVRARKGMMGIGKGQSKQVAEARAAADLLKKLDIV